MLEQPITKAHDKKMDISDEIWGQSIESNKTKSFSRLLGNIFSIIANTSIPFILLHKTTISEFKEKEFD